MLINGLDLETTGLEQSEGHRIVEVAILTFDFASSKLVDKYVQRIDPERSIAAQAQEVHGISYTELVGQPKWEKVAPEVARRLAMAPIMVAHNVNFDGPFIGAELARVGERVPNVEPFCTMEQGRFATFDGKLPKLQELCFAFGVEYDLAKAHAAEYDVIKMMDCFFRGVDRGFYVLPEGLSLKEAA